MTNFTTTSEQLGRRQLTKDLKRRYAAITEAIRAAKNFRSLPQANGTSDPQIKWPYSFTPNLTSLQEHATVLCMMRAHMRGRLHVEGTIYKKKEGHKVTISTLTDQAAFIQKKADEMLRFFTAAFRMDSLLDQRTADPSLRTIFAQITGEVKSEVVTKTPVHVVIGRPVAVPVA